MKDNVQKNLVVEFFKEHPDRDIKHPEVVTLGNAVTVNVIETIMRKLLRWRTY